MFNGRVPLLCRFNFFCVSRFVNIYIDQNSFKKTTDRTAGGNSTNLICVVPVFHQIYKFSICPPHSLNFVVKKTSTVYHSPVFKSVFKCWIVVVFALQRSADAVSFPKCAKICVFFFLFCIQNSVAE